MGVSEKRRGDYERVSALEELLKELNTNLAGANENYLKESDERFPKVFLMGPHRSGSTLVLQWLASTGVVAYPTNLLSRFFGAPLIGAKIQQLLTDPRYNFRNEILDFNAGIDFTSENGKTRGALAPNEFWYFWRRFLPSGQTDYLPPNELRRGADLAGLRDELNALANIFEKPFAMKAMIMNENILALAEQFEKAIFIWIRRDPIFNIQSALEARKRQFGDIHTWYSFKIKEYPELKGLDPLYSVAGQIAAINRSVGLAFERLGQDQKVLIKYEEFCQEPKGFFSEIIEKLKPLQGVPLENLYDYRQAESFRTTNRWRLEEYTQEEAIHAYESFS